MKFRRRLFTSSLKSKIRQSHVEVVQKRQRNVQKKKVKCTSKVVVLPTKTIVVFDFLVAVASSDRKVPFFSHEAAT